MAAYQKRKKKNFEKEIRMKKPKTLLNSSVVYKTG